MRILIVNKFYFLFGGTERYLFNLTDVLQEMNHTVIPFAMQHENNRETPYSKYFVSKVDLSIARKKVFSNEVKAVGRIFYSFEAKKKLRELIANVRPDIAHVRNVYHQLSPSVLSVLKEMGIPSVLTAADYKMICPNYDMFYNGKICDACKGGRFYHTVIKRCVRNSLAASALLALESTLHRTLLNSYQRNIDVFIAPSKFVRQKLVESGFPEERVVHLSHFCDSSKYVPSYDSDNYIVFFGRVDHRKGLLTLINAVRHLPTKLVIVGDGPERTTLEIYVTAQGISNVSFAGHKSGDDLQSIIRRASFSVLPSESNETFGHTILESFACGKPVIASMIGAIPELIKEGENGLLFQPGNVAQLKAKIFELINDPAKKREMGKNGRLMVEKDYRPKEHYEKLMTIYKNLIK